ncbi:MAG: outer membrane lipoprotein chaperone LolA, partial [Acidiferrobacterales bacterium]
MLKKFGLFVSTIALFTVYASAVGAGQTSVGSSTGLLERFFNNVRTYQADFTQVVMDAEGNSIQESSGRFWIKRPGKFRWDYKKPFTQKIIGDGKKVWIYDPELKQVTV